MLYILACLVGLMFTSIICGYNRVQRGVCSITDCGRTRLQDRNFCRRHAGRDQDASSKSI